ncbi:hypothetical protein ACFQRB_09080 [Halobaculum litoreum]|uniref:Uncharacterized protein n=1 Tax=Halobaculum litoreum TaxID=3031998 RepID=A0ABD5XU93_9EURY
MPNNEFLDPETDRASVISEVGSHSSALGVNETKDTFERLPITTEIPDISNGALALTDLPAAYGLPRGEGYRLPFAMPELDGAPIHEHPELPNVARDHLVPAGMTVESFAGLPSPPGDLPLRETGHRFAFDGSETAPEADYTYELVPMAEMTVAEFTGPQLPSSSRSPPSRRTPSPPTSRRRGRRRPSRATGTRSRTCPTRATVRRCPSGSTLT